MPKMHVEKTVFINAPAQKVYDIVSNFNHWVKWSPWLITEPEAKVVIAEDLKQYSWEGKRVGSGNMKVTSENKTDEVIYDLNFLKPWKSYAKVKFSLQPKGDQTLVSWHMDSSLPFFMFWMKKSMEAFVGNDYSRGLAMLKDYVEDEKVHSELEFKGTTDFAGFQYIGVKTSCAIETVSTAMEKDFSELWAFLADKSSLVAGKAFTIYHKWDMKNGLVSYTSGVPVNNLPDNLPGNMVSGKIPPVKVNTIIHKGPHAHLGNAWSTQQFMMRNKEFKVNKKIHPFELYINNSQNVSQNELITEVNVPLA